MAESKEKSVETVFVLSKMLNINDGAVSFRPSKASGEISSL